ncbi:MAG: PolC-type DNA polymerase III [Firmicutes bacterium]|nr:PolC-type DNA polymerase III [Bacillota bacterium]
MITPRIRGQCLSEFLRAAQLPVNCEGTAARIVVEKVLVDAERQEWKICLTPTDDLCPQELDRLGASLVAILPGVRSVCFESTEDSEVPGSGVAQNEVEGTTTSDRELLFADEATYMSMVMERAARETNDEAAPVSHNNSRERVRVGQVLKGRSIREAPRSIDEINDEERSCVIGGEIIHIDEKELRSGRRLLQIDVTDYHDSITLKLFENEDAARLSADLAIGTWIRARGPIQWDRYTQELTMLPNDIQRQQAPEKLLRQDDAPKKRIELHLHTKMSAMDGTVEVGEVIRLAASWGHKAIAITDHGVVQAFPEAHLVGKRAGIKVIYGMEGYLVEGEDPRAASYHVVLLARNRQGLCNLYRLVSLSHLKYFYRRPRLPRRLIEEYRAGLLIGSACEAGEVYQACLNGADDRQLARIASFYDYLEIQPLGNNAFLVGERVSSEQELKSINSRLVKLGKRLGKPVVATGDVHYLQPWDEVYRRILMAGQGYEDAERQAPLFFRTTEEMLEEFAYLGEATASEVVLEGPNQIADLIEDLQPVPDGLHAPKIEGADEQVVAMTYANAHRLYGDPLPKIVEDRIQKELNAIVGNGFAVLYFIAHKLVKKSLDDGYLVGSRGSVGSSLVATLCGVTEVNPLPPHYVCPDCHHSEFLTNGSIEAGVDLLDRQCECGTQYQKLGFDIPFEVFLGFHGEKVPDIDLNFSGEYQNVVHKYTEELFGADYVFRAGTIGTLAEKTSYGFVRKYLESKGRTARMPEINRLVRGCTGVRRTTGQHPGGMIVVPQGHDINEFTPVQHPANDGKNGIITTHFDYNAISEQLVKLDILGHDDPTMIRMLEDTTGIDAVSIPLDDPDTMAIFSGVEVLGVTADDLGTNVGTLGIPEFGTRFVRQMLEETRPTTFGELVRISGFSHGTNVWANNAQDLIREGIADLGQAIATRDDIMNYLIQLGMEPAVAFQIMERVRKGRGLRPEDIQAMEEAGVPRWYLDSCKKISYLFPKAHAVAYVTMAFRIAYFKVHHPLAFYAAYFTVRADSFSVQLTSGGLTGVRDIIERIAEKGNGATAKEKAMLTVAEVVLEAMLRGIGFQRVDIYQSDPTRFVIQGQNLLPPLAAVPGVGDTAALTLAQGREDAPFTSWEDIRMRCGVSRTVIETLASYGALPGLPETAQLSLF